MTEKERANSSSFCKKANETVEEFCNYLFPLRQIIIKVSKDCLKQCTVNKSLGLSLYSMSLFGFLAFLRTLDMVVTLF